jgi:protein arginine kinase activator
VLTMICEHCHKEIATVFLTQVYDGKKIELHLCNHCAKEKEALLYDNTSSFQQFLGGLLKLSNNAVEERSDLKAHCEQCGLTLDEFRKNSKLGCSSCYNSFEPYIKHIVKSVHGSFEHTGKKPTRMYHHICVADKIADLESQLRLALLQENYYEAALIRDELHQVKEVEG